MPVKHLATLPDGRKVGLVLFDDPQWYIQDATREQGWRFLADEEIEKVAAAIAAAAAAF